MPLNWRGNLWYYLEGNEFTVWMLHTHTHIQVEKRAKQTWQWRARLHCVAMGTLLLSIFAILISLSLSLFLVSSFHAYFLPFLLYPSLSRSLASLPEKCIFSIVFYISILHCCAWLHWFWNQRHYQCWFARVTNTYSRVFFQILILLVFCSIITYLILCRFDKIFYSLLLRGDLTFRYDFIIIYKSAFIYLNMGLYYSLYGENW